MKIERKEKEKATILLPAGDLIYEGVGELETLFEALINDSRYVILDLTNTRYLSARALGTIAFYMRLFRDKQRGLKLVHVSENIKKIFDITGILKIIEIFDSEDAALASIGSQVGKLEKMLLWSNEYLR
ncbi:MAG: STAS domain-containing protein [Candidatus Brocadia sp.]|jgi:anti-anti-sigma factor